MLKEIMDLGTLHVGLLKRIACELEASKKAKIQGSSRIDINIGIHLE